MRAFATGWCKLLGGGLNLSLFVAFTAFTSFTSFTPSANAQELKGNLYFSQSPLVVRGANPHLIPISGRITLDLSNVSSTAGTSFLFVLPPNSTNVVLSSLAVTGPSPAANFQATSGPGDYRAVPDDYVYALPFEVGEIFRVDQGEGGSFSHQSSSPQNHLAIDFGMAVGTPLHAIRDGIVFEVVEDKPSGGNDPNLAGDANYVRVLHSDGTFAEYVHLRQNGVSVELGDTVERGQMIGFSGDSGYVDGAHLHLSLIRNNFDNNPTAPFRSVSMTFDTAQGSPIVLQQGTTYSHPSTTAEAPRILLDGITLSWTVPAGTSFQVEASTDLVTWTAVSQVLESTGARMTATTNRSNPVELYRMRLIP